MATPQDFARQLEENGFVVVPIFDEDKLHTLQQEFNKTLRNLPEYKPDIDGTFQYSKTGFGALGTASSFHNPLVRYLRLEIFKRVFPLFEAYEGLYGKGLMRRFFHTLFDRMLVRAKGQKASEEGCHRDVSLVSEGDTVFGGWLSLTDGQFVSLVPGTHHLPSEGTGFVKIQGEFLEECNRKCELHEVPAGSILIMNQNIVHKVTNSSSKKKEGGEMMRLFLGWRLTNDDEDLLAKQGKNSNPRQDGKGDAQDLQQIIAEQGVPKIASNQLPSLYNLRSVDTPAQQAGLNAWVQKHIKEELLEEEHPDSFFRTTRDANGNRKRKYPHALPPLHMPSLREIGQMYPPYKRDDIIILMPHSFADAKALLNLI